MVLDPDKLTRTQTDRLGDRLREGRLSEVDLRALDSYRRSFNEPYESVIEAIRAHIGLEPTGRPAKSTKSIIDKLNREIAAVLQLPEMQDRFRQMGMEAASSTPEGMTERLRKDLERWRDVIGKLGLRQ